MDKIARIRQEIERRTKELDNDKYINIDARECRKSELGYILRFLNTLSEEPDKSLEEEIKRYIPRDQCPVPDFMEAVARHFYELGKNSK